MGVAIVGMLVVTAGTQPALAQETEQSAEAQGTDQAPATQDEAVATEDEEKPVFIEEIVIKGFRRSLEQSVDLKRAAVNVRDSIVAEDIGKMPDLNLAEAIQRVPGVAIVREGGEGRQMSLRGLGAGFTRVTLNGMEVPSSTGGLDSSGGVNRGRTFDFNVFSAELFNRIDVNKSAIASIEEGGLAGSVEMYTARPLDNPGTRGTVSVQAGYNDLSEDVSPRPSAPRTRPRPSASWSLPPMRAALRTRTASVPCAGQSPTDLGSLAPGAPALTSTRSTRTGTRACPVRTASATTRRVSV